MNLINENSVTSTIIMYKYLVDMFTKHGRVLNPQKVKGGSLIVDVSPNVNNCPESQVV